MNEPVITWLLMGVGVILLYSAYRKRSPLSVVTTSIGAK
jgi:hypothetical protein